MSRTSARKVFEQIDECLLILDFVNSIYWIFDIPSSTTPAQTTMWIKLQDWRQQVFEVQNKPRQAILANADAMLAGLPSIRKMAEQNRHTCPLSPCIFLRCDRSL
jgi:hypothetical protein